MLNESKYYKNGIISSTSSSSQNSTSSTSSSSNVKQNSIIHEQSKSLHNTNHHHFNLQTFNQYNQPIKSGVNLNGKNFNDYNNSSISKDFFNSNFDNTSKMSNIHSNALSASKNGYSSNCSSTSSSTSSTGSVNVKFTGFFKDKVDEREKYLTAKYPNHQMALIKKRLKVEFWMDEQLKILFNISVSISFSHLNNIVI